MEDPCSLLHTFPWSTLGAWLCGIGVWIKSVRTAADHARALFLHAVFCISFSFANSSAGQAGLRSSLKYFPVGPIYEYRWKILELVLAHTRDEADNVRLERFAGEVTQNHGISLLHAGSSTLWCIYVLLEWSLPGNRKHKEQFPQLMAEKNKALVFPYPVYFLG